jgi:hypothetical protein
MFIIETYCVLCEVGTGGFSRRPLTTESWVRFLVSLRLGVEKVTQELVFRPVIRFPLSVSVSVSVSVSSPEWCCHKDKRTKPENLPTKHLTIKHCDVCIT